MKINKKLLYSISPLILILPPLSISTKLNDKNKEINFIDKQLDLNETFLLEELSQIYDESKKIFKSYKQNVELDGNIKLNIDNYHSYNVFEKYINNLSKKDHFRFINKKNKDVVYNDLFMKNIFHKKTINISPNQDKFLISPTLFSLDSNNFFEYYERRWVPGPGYPILINKSYWEQNGIKLNIHSDKSYGSFVYDETGFIRLPKRKIINSRITKSISYVSKEIKEFYDLDFNSELLFEDENNKIVSFEKKQIFWEKFFSLSASEMELNDNRAYSLNNKPIIKLGLNLPLVYNIYWYGKTWVIFQELLNKANKIKNLFDQQENLYKKLFENKENFFIFFNSILINILNFMYTEKEYKIIKEIMINIESNIIDSEFIYQIRNFINKKDIIYNGNKINIKGSNLSNKNMLKNELNIEPPKHIIDNDIYSSFLIIDNNSKINNYNTWSEIILPIILNQNIFVTFVDESGIQKKVKAYDGIKHKFIVDAISPVPKNNDFIHPYSKTIIKKIEFGDDDVKKFLGMNTEINFENNTKPLFKILKNNNLTFTSNGIKVLFKYVTKEKDINPNAWYSSIINSDKKTFLLLDDPWKNDEYFSSILNSKLDIILSDNKIDWIIKSSLVKPFLLDNNLNKNKLDSAISKYIYDDSLMILNKENISNFLLTNEFKKTYSKNSSNPWYLWKFKDLIKENESNIKIFKTGKYQLDFLNSFIKKSDFKNNSFDDFFPKNSQAKFYSFVSYKPSILTAEHELKENRGFYYLGNELNEDNTLKRINYLICIQTKNKEYFSNMKDFVIKPHQNQNIISYEEYSIFIKNLIEEIKEKFAIFSQELDGAKFKPNVKFVSNNYNENEFISSGHGKIIIDYNGVVPNYFNNESDKKSYLNINEIKGIEEFKKRFCSYIIFSEKYESLNEREREKYIFIDEKNKQIIIGGWVLSNIRKSIIGGIDAKENFVINSKIVNPNINWFGFDKKTKSHKTIKQIQDHFNSLTQQEMFNILFNWNNEQNIEVLKLMIKKFDAKFNVNFQNNKLNIRYKFKSNSILYDSLIKPIPLKHIKQVRLDSINPKLFSYGYIRDNDKYISFNELVESLKNPKNFKKYFNIDNKKEKDFFEKGIEFIKVIEANPKNSLIKLKIEMKKDFISYDLNDILIIKAIEKKKISIGNFHLKNIPIKIKENILKLSSKQEILNYLNNLNINLKKQFLTNSINKEKIKNIKFNFDKENLMINFIFVDDAYELDKKNINKIPNFIHSLNKEYNGNKNKIILIIVGCSVICVLTLLISFILFKKKKVKK